MIHVVNVVEVEVKVRFHAFIQEFCTVIRKIIKAKKQNTIGIMMPALYPNKNVLFARENMFISVFHLCTVTGHITHP